MMTELHTIPTALSRLQRQAPPGGRILSAYLDTTPERIARQAHVLALRDGCKAIRAALPPGEHKAFEAAVEQVEYQLARSGPFHHPGLALFAAPDPRSVYAVPLPVRPVEDVDWGEQPVVEPLQQIVDDYERIAVVLFDQQRARLFVVHLGEVEARQEIEDDVPRRVAVGGWYGLAQKRLARHREDHVLRHVRHVIAALGELAHAYPFDRLLLAGPDDGVAMLRRHLPARLHARLTGTIALPGYATDTDVLAAAAKVAEMAERRSEFTLVSDLLDAGGAPAVVGVDATLAALSNGQVHLLVVANTLSGTGGECPACARLFASAARCPSCGGPLTAVGDLRDLAIRRAAEHGARVEIVSGEPAVRLLAQGGLGAWTRYG